MAASGSKTPPTGIMSGRDSPPAASGIKTPRKVQWLETHKEGEYSPHALDEHGNDPNAFETLKTALERHQAAPPVARVHYFPPRPAGMPRINTDQPLELPSAPTTVSSDGDASGPPSPTRSVPGNYIGPHEQAGLPGTTNLEDYSHRTASKVVRAHTRKGFFAGKLHFGGKQKEKQKQKQKQREAEAEAGHERDGGDVERNLGSIPPMNPTLGGGVLSALLTLYNEADGTAASGASTPSTFQDPPELPWITPPHSAKKPSTRRAATAEEIPLIGNSTAGISKQGSSSPEDAEAEADAVGRTHASRTDSQSSLALTAAANALHNALPHKHKQRTGGGVLGALIASTGNISGAAAPTSSQLAPNMERPGYHLSRYSVADADDRPRAMEPRPKERERPKSMPSSALPGPGAPLTWTATMNSMADTLASKRGWTEKLRDLEHVAFGGRSGRSTPAQTPSSSTDHEEWLDEKVAREQEGRRDKRRKRKKAEVYITRHVAQIIQRQEFILKLVRALMMFGGPSHRLQAQIQATGRVLDIQVNCMYLPDVVLISFDDSSTGTSNLKFIRQGSALNLGKLNEAYALYWSVIHDEQSVSEASSALDELMRKKQEYTWWQLVLTGGMCSASICTVSFNGSFIDALVSFPLGALLVAIQLLSVRNELYSNVFEITVATLFSFISAALASTGKFCYSAVASSSVVLILPGFIVLCGSLEIMSRNIVSGSVRMCYAVVYSLFLGFGLAMGAEAYEKMTSRTIVGSTDYACSVSHNAEGPWWQRTPSLYFAFLTVPMYSLFLSMRNHAPWRNKEMLLLVGISCIGWVTNHFTGTKFVNQSDISAAVGAFAVGAVANIYARFFSGNAFVIMITGILFQVPSGLGKGGLLTFASETASGSSNSYLSGFQTALQLISVAIGLTVGLGISLVLVHPIQSRRRAGGVFSL
ncbi:hypothetical protein B0H11DRAFT_545821 [Mycena galericulata]|nr:hypothetical protein B0H11DRAFT_545821 [Mycena galericulata]